MKRSEYIAIGAIGVLLVATFWPRSDPSSDPVIDTAAAGGSGFTTLAFASLDECRQSQAVTEQECRAEWGKAQEGTIADAPKYDTLASCEEEYGANQCRPATWNGASVFIPALAGVLIARSLAGAATASQPLYPPRTGPASCPPGYNPADRPECQTRTASSSSGGGSGGGRSYYSTGTGRSIGRVTGSVIADAVLPSRTTVTRSTVTTRSSTSSGSWSSSTSRSSSGLSTSSSPTASRGGFGSSGFSFGSSS